MKRIPCYATPVFTGGGNNNNIIALKRTNKPAKMLPSLAEILNHFAIAAWSNCKQQQLRETVMSTFSDDILTDCRERERLSRQAVCIHSATICGNLGHCKQFGIY